MKYFKRRIEKEILDNLNEPEAIFILGARQVGKTSLMKRIMSNLDNDSYIYIDLENPDNLLMFNKGINEFLAYLNYQDLNDSKRIYIFIDEIQYAQDFSGLIKYFVDHYSDKYKLILSGSSSLQIRSQFKESLVGRKKIFELYPLTFSEFCLFKGEDKISKILENIKWFSLSEDPLRFESKKVKNLLYEFLIYGGFPKVVLQKSKIQKIEVLQDIVQSYILKDIRYIFNLEKITQFNHLIKLLAAFSTKELNISQLATETHLHKQTLEHYINALEYGYIINIIHPFYKNFSSELRKTPKCFFLDNGLRNYLISNFNNPEFRTDRGELLENYVFTQLKKKANIFTKINFWRTKAKREIDFIIRNEDKLYAIVVKWHMDSLRNLKKFQELYPNSKLFLFSMLKDFDKKKSILPVYLV